MSYLGSQFQRSGAYKKLEMVHSWKTKQNMRAFFTKVCPSDLPLSGEERGGGGGRKRRRSHLKVFLFLALVAILFNEADGLSNFGRQSPKEHSCEIISKSVRRFGRRSR